MLRQVAAMPASGERELADDPTEHEERRGEVAEAEGREAAPAETEGTVEESMGGALLPHV